MILRRIDIHYLMQSSSPFLGGCERIIASIRSSLSSKAFCFIILLSFLASPYSVAQRVILLEKDGGIYKLPCTVNGVKMKMIFDTGATFVSLSSSMADYLFRNGFLLKDDIIGEGKSQIADGSFVNNTIINIRDIEIPGIHLRNVTASVNKGQNAPLLFGQSAIQKLGNITIEQDRIILNDVPTSYNAQDLLKIRKEIKNFIHNNAYNAALEVLERLDAIIEISTEDYINYANCYYSTRQYQKCLNVCKRWIKKYDNNPKTTIEDKSRIYAYIKYVYRDNEIVEEALHWYQKAIEIDKQILNDYEPLIADYHFIAYFYEKKGNYHEASRNYIKEAQTIRLEFGFSFDDIFNQTGDIIVLNEQYYNAASCLMKLYNEDSSLILNYLTLATLCGSEKAAYYLDSQNYDFNELLDGCKKSVKTHKIIY